MVVLVVVDLPPGPALAVVGLVTGVGLERSLLELGLEEVVVVEGLVTGFLVY